MKALSALALLLVVTGVQAKPQNCYVGQVTNLVGSVELERAGQKITPEKGMTICRGDLFRTTQSAIAELNLRDGTKLTVGKDSAMVIRDYRIFKKKPNLAFFELLQGAFRSISGSITKRPHVFEVKTGLATIGVRGTDFWGGFGVTPDGALDVIMIEGHGVYVKNGQNQVELDKAGLGTTVHSDGSIGPAKTWPDEKVKRAFATVTLEPTP